MSETGFAARMRELRTERGMSLRKLAATAFYGKSYLHELETGMKEPTPQAAKRIDDALGAGGTLADRRGWLAGTHGGGRRTTGRNRAPRPVGPSLHVVGQAGTSHPPIEGRDQTDALNRALRLAAIAQEYTVDGKLTLLRHDGTPVEVYVL